MSIVSLLKRLSMQAQPARQFIGSLPPGADLLDSLTRVCRENNIRLGTFSLIGSVTDIHVGYYNQVTHKYIDHILNEERREIVSCIGNISIKDSEPYAHGHIIFSDDKGQCLGGHLMRGTRVFAAEYHIQELAGAELVRRPDQATGLNLWGEDNG